MISETLVLFPGFYTSCLVMSRKRKPHVYKKTRVEIIKLEYDQQQSICLAGYCVGGKGRQVDRWADTQTHTKSQRERDRQRERQKTNSRETTDKRS